MLKGAMVDPAATRTRILDTATKLFYERGVHAVGVNEIAAAAGASKLSLYRYFPSKHALVEAMLTERSDRIHAWLQRCTTDTPPGPSRVLAVFDLLIGWFAEPGYHGCVIVNGVTDTRGDPSTAAVARRHLARYRSLLEDRLRDLSVADPAGLARQLLLLIEGATTVTAIDGNPAAGHDARAAAEALLSAAPGSSSSPEGGVAVATHLFTGTLEADPRGGALVALPDQVLGALGGGSRFRVTGTLNGVSFASSTMTTGAGRVCLGVHKATRQAAVVAIGDVVDVEIERDVRPRELVVPDDLAAALAGDAAATEAFQRLSFTRRREHVEWVTNAKREDTRAGRIVQTLDQLRA